MSHFEGSIACHMISILRKKVHLYRQRCLYQVRLFGYHYYGEYFKKLDTCYTLPQPNRCPKRNTKSVLIFHIAKLSMLCVANAMPQFPKVRKTADKP